MSDAMFTNHLNLIKGGKPGQPWVADRASLKKAGQGTIVAGCVVHLDPANTSGSPAWKRGLPTPTPTTAAVPYLAWNSDTDFDVIGDDYNMVGAGDGTGTSQQALITAICCAQSSEVETPNFVDDTYAPGDLLISDASGVLKQATGGANEIIVGVVTDGIVPSAYKSTQDVLRFMTTFQILLNTTYGS